MDGMIKPLVWESFDAWTHWAKLDRGSYYIEERNGKWRLGWRINDQSVPLMHTEDTLPTDLDAAKLAAQADYAARITAALDPAWLARQAQLKTDLANTIAANAALVKRLEEARGVLHFYSDFHENPNDGPWGVNSQDFGKSARAFLAGDE